MEPVEVTDGVWQLPLAVGHVYAVRLGDGLALVDTGMPGSAPEVLDGVRRIGAAPRDVRQILLTHSHVDHTGSAADLAAATGARVLAGAADAPFVRGDAPEPGWPMSASERALAERIGAGALAPAPPVAVDVELRDGDALDGWPDGAAVVAVPGHTPGSIAVHLPASGVLFSGDTIAAFDGRAMLGPFNVDRDGAVAGFRRLAGLGADVLCVPHGDPVRSGGAAALAAASPGRDWL